jgi:hypothetical protein
MTSRTIAGSQAPTTKQIGVNMNDTCADCGSPSDERAGFNRPLCLACARLEILAIDRQVTTDLAFSSFLEENACEFCLVELWKNGGM